MMFCVIFDRVICSSVMLCCCDSVERGFVDRARKTQIRTSHRSQSGQLGFVSRDFCVCAVHDLR